MALLATQLGQREAVQEAGPEDGDGAHQEVGPGQEVVQHVPGQHSGHDDGYRGGETFEDVVSKLDSGGHHQATEGLEDDDCDH